MMANVTQRIQAADYRAKLQKPRKNARNGKPPASERWSAWAPS